MTTRSKIQFKALTSQQSVLFPSNLGEKIPSSHPVRIINRVVDQLNIDDIVSTYKGGGTSSYHPRMMLKILFYSYFCNIYSCRKIAQVLEENIYFMWLSGNSTPDFRTINEFRGKRLKEKIQTLFSELVQMMAELGFVSLDIQYIDGTKIESASNRYTFVWKGSVEKNKAKLKEKIKDVLQDIEQSIKDDTQAAGKDQQREEDIDPGKLQEKIDELNHRLDQLNKKQQKAVKQLEQKHLPKLKEYDKQLDTLEGRNSYSKTDPDATFMRMKEDHMKNGQLKPAYNIQISTENQFLTNFSIHRRPGDTATLASHLEQFKKHYNKQSTKVVADAGYGSEQNYELMEGEDIEAFVKYNYFHKEQKRGFKQNIFHPDNLFYNAGQDYFVCPMGQHMEKTGEQNRKSELGYISTVTIYKAKCCQGCPLHGQCHNGKEARQIEINHNLRRHKAIARDRLMSEEGRKLRSKRAIEPEAVFGQLKSNNKFNRFKLRGLKKVEIEFGLAGIAHNLRKLSNLLSQNPKNERFEQFLSLYQQFLWLLFQYRIVFYGSNDPIKISSLTLRVEIGHFQNIAA